MGEVEPWECCSLPLGLGKGCACVFSSKCQLISFLLVHMLIYQANLSYEAEPLLKICA